MRWLKDYEMRQRARDATVSMKLDRVEAALALLSSQLQVTAHSYDSDQHANTDNEASQMASGPSAQSLIERGVRDGWSQ